MPAQNPPDLSGDSDTRGTDHRARPKFQVMTILDSFRPDNLLPPGWWGQGVTDRGAGWIRPGITLLGQPLAANGRCSDGMSTPAARRDQDAQSARRLGYVKHLPLEADEANPGRDRWPRPRANGPPASRKGPPGGGHFLAKGGHPNSHNLAALNLHRNKTPGHPKNKIPLDRISTRCIKPPPSRKPLAKSTSLPSSPSKFSTPRTFHVLHPLPTLLFGFSFPVSAR